MILKLLTIIALCLSVEGLQLKQVVVLSRHNIRTPVTSVAVLKQFTEKKWPTWKVQTGYLTKKGGLLERNFGKYFSEWLIKEKLLENNCTGNEAFIYSNTLQRTKETAKAFAKGAFGNCVPVRYKNITGMDPVFNPVVRNDTQEFKDIVLSEMRKKVDAISLTEAYKELEKILDFKNSLLCKKDVCDLMKDSEKSKIIILELLKEPDFYGPIKIANVVVDAFLMAYYDGRPNDEVAWGELTTPEQWETLLTAVKTYHDLLFKTRILSKDLASTLLEYMTDIFLNKKKKFYLLVGHDFNINTLIAAMNFKDYNLHDQHEKTPIGGKLVFQKWYDEANDRDLMRVNYVYQSTKQIRDGAVLSLENPPQWALMEIENCKVDENGFCLWKDFVKVLKSL